jgi:hypothetical protein
MSTVSTVPLTGRNILAASWPLFQVSWLGCLPLALIGVAASGSPQAAAIAGGEARGLVHSGEWWGLYFASALLTLICHGGVVLRQFALAEGLMLTPFEALRGATRRLPQSAATAVLLLAPLAVAIGLAPQTRLAAGALLLAGGALLVWQAFAWPAALREGLTPIAALRRGATLVRGRVLSVAGIVGTAFAVVLVFVLLAGILLGIVMGIAGMKAPSGALQLGLSRLLIAALIAVPSVWLGAVWVTAYRQLAGRPGQP